MKFRLISTSDREAFERELAEATADHWYLREFRPVSSPYHIWYIALLEKDCRPF